MRDTPTRPCHVPGCPALALPAKLACAIHDRFHYRQASQAPLRCASCDGPIGIGAAYTSRFGRVLCAKTACQSSDPSSWFGPKREPPQKASA